jgi:hypothetical protein
MWKNQSAECVHSRLLSHCELYRFPSINKKHTLTDISLASTMLVILIAPPKITNTL